MSEGKDIDRKNMIIEAVERGIDRLAEWVRRGERFVVATHSGVAHMDETLGWAFLMRFGNIDKVVRVPTEQALLNVLPRLLEQYGRVAILDIGSSSDKVVDMALRDERIALLDHHARELGPEFPSTIKLVLEALMRGGVEAIQGKWGELNIFKAIDERDRVGPQQAKEVWIDTEGDESSVRFGNLLWNGVSEYMINVNEVNRGDDIARLMLNVVNEITSREKPYIDRVKITNVVKQVLDEYKERYGDAFAFALKVSPFLQALDALSRWDLQRLYSVGAGGKEYGFDVILLTMSSIGDDYIIDMIRRMLRAALEKLMKSVELAMKIKPIEVDGVKVFAVNAEVPPAQLYDMLVELGKTSRDEPSIVLIKNPRGGYMMWRSDSIRHMVDFRWLEPYRDELNISFIHNNGFVAVVSVDDFEKAVKRAVDAAIIISKVIRQRQEQATVNKNA